MEQACSLPALRTSIIIGTSLRVQKRTGSQGLSGYLIACAPVTRRFKAMYIYRFVSRRKGNERTSEKLRDLLEPTLLFFPFREPRL